METLFSFSIDDAGMGDPEAMRRPCRYFEKAGVRATWFVVPRGGGKPMTDEWMRTVREAREAGQDIQLHGLTHADCFEFGPPNWPATALSPGFQREFDGRRKALLPRYTRENLRGWIEEGREIFAQDLGVTPTLFRAPCGAISKAMFAALAEAGIRYHTCQYLSATGYHHLRGAPIVHEWADVALPRPYRWYSGVIEVPILNEYTWRGASAHEAAYRAVATADIEKVKTLSPVATILMHTHGIASDYDYAFRMIDHVIEQAGGPQRIATMGDLAARGVYDEAALDEGADTLAV